MTNSIEKRGIMKDTVIYICQQCGCMVYRYTDDTGPGVCSKCRCILKRKFNLEKDEEKQD